MMQPFQPMQPYQPPPPASTPPQGHVGEGSQVHHMEGAQQKQQISPEEVKAFLGSCKENSNWIAVWKGVKKVGTAVTAIVLSPAGGACVYALGAYKKRQQLTKLATNLAVINNLLANPNIEMKEESRAELKKMQTELTVKLEDATKSWTDAAVGWKDKAENWKDTLEDAKVKAGNVKRYIFGEELMPTREVDLNDRKIDHKDSSLLSRSFDKVMADGRDRLARKSNANELTGLAAKVAKMPSGGQAGQASVVQPPPYRPQQNPSSPPTYQPPAQQQYQQQPPYQPPIQQQYQQQPPYQQPIQQQYQQQPPYQQPIQQHQKDNAHAQQPHNIGGSMAPVENMFMFGNAPIMQLPDAGEALAGASQVASGALEVAGQAGNIVLQVLAGIFQLLG